MYDKNNCNMIYRGVGYSCLEDVQYKAISTEIIDILSTHKISISQARTLFQQIINQLECEPIRSSFKNIPSCTSPSNHSKYVRYSHSTY